MEYHILDSIASPEDIKKLSMEECRALCTEMRSFLIESVSKTGGHLASNLGAVELTVAIHRVFDTAKDRLVFDVGHQCYVHKALTGRKELFSTLRTFGGLSGFPKPYESEHDAFIAGHASNSVSVALGMAWARTLRGENENILALIGDGALTGGLSYEGLNNAGASKIPMIVLLNDNGMSISRNVGGVASHLAKIRNRPGYYQFKKRYHGVMQKIPGGKKIYRGIHRMKTDLKKALWPCSFFEDMGFQYLGPVDGHNLDQLCHVLSWAKAAEQPVVVHINTIKGKGYSYAEENPDRFHGISPFDPETGKNKSPSGENFSKVCGETLSALADQDQRICTITAAMESGTGLDCFAKDHPDRFFDVGIAEGHAVSMAAGMAANGMLPVFAVYSSFLQRGFDMLLHDVGLMQLHTVFAVDRAGLVGLSRGAAECCRTGGDFTLVSYGILFNEALDAADLLAEQGISVELVKLNTIQPLDMEMISASTAKTGRLFVLEECVENGCVGQRIAADLAEKGKTPTTVILKNLGNQYTPQGKTALLKRSVGLDGESVAKAIKEAMQNGEETT